MTAVMTRTDEQAPRRAPRVLVVDDEHLIRWSLRQRLEDDGFEVVEAAQGSEALEIFAKGCDLVLLDWLLPDVNGQEVMRRMRGLRPNIPIIMLTAHSSVEHAVDVMKAGAYHYTGKPFDLDEVVQTVQTALRTGQAAVSAADSGAKRVGPIIGESAAVRELRQMLQRVATSPASTVLLVGESGTGKGLAAHEVHEQSPRSGRPFLTATCSALPALLLESELFGHEPGAFADASNEKVGLIERADGGTLFLDDVADLDPTVQSKLMRFLEDRRFRRMGGSTDRSAEVRIIASTNTDLRQLVDEGRFREDLYYRLAVLTVRVPPLRERKSDIPILTRYFIELFSREFSKNVEGVSREAAELLENHPWRGNIRELRNCLERAVLLCDDPLIGPGSLTLDGSIPDDDGDYHLPNQGVDLQELERRLLIQALERANGNRTRAGQLLGMNRDQVRYRIEKFNLEDLDPKRRHDK